MACLGFRQQRSASWSAAPDVGSAAQRIEYENTDRDEESGPEPHLRPAIAHRPRTELQKEANPLRHPQHLAAGTRAHVVRVLWPTAVPLQFCTLLFASLKAKAMLDPRRGGKLEGDLRCLSRGGFRIYSLGFSMCGPTDLLSQARPLLFWKRGKFYHPSATNRLINCPHHADICQAFYS